MTLRAALPDGWMPSSGAEAAPIMLCPGMNDMAAMPAMAGMEHNAPQKPSHDRNHSSGTLCIFAAAAHFAASSNAPVLAPAPHAITIALPASHDAPPGAPSYRANAARAPPALV
jgi:hypothetical protein